MIYIIMKEAQALAKGIIPEDHYFPKNDEQVIFKKDLLTIYSQQGHSIDFEYEELETAQAINKIDTWK